MLAGMLAGCGGSSQSGTAISTTDFAQSPKWAADGARVKLAEAKACNNTAFGDFAYKSIPISIDHPGTYAVYYGPLDKNFKLPVLGSHGSPVVGPGWAYDIPQDLQVPSYPDVSSPDGIVNMNGGRWPRPDRGVTTTTTSIFGCSSKELRLIPR